MAESIIKLAWIHFRHLHLGSGVGPLILAFLWILVSHFAFSRHIVLSETLLVELVSTKESMATDSSILPWRIPIDRGSWWATVDGVAENRKDWMTKHSTLLCQANRIRVDSSPWNHVFINLENIVRSFISIFQEGHNHFMNILLMNL